MSVHNEQDDQHLYDGADPQLIADPWDAAAVEAGVTQEAALSEAKAMAKLLNPLLDDDDAADDGAAAAKLSDSLTAVHDSLLAAEGEQAAQQVFNDLLARVGEANPRPRIAPVRRFAELAGVPQASYPVIQVAGTNGKTSTSRIIESLLRAHGLRTGLFTSPHLIDFTERFQIDGEPINGVDLALAWHSLQPALQVVDRELAEQQQGPITFFEALAVLAFAAFADAPVDVAVIEVGMGGEWDATNIVDADVAVVTPVALDHVGILGNTIAEIAATKAKIIKAGAIAVSAAQDPAAAAEITRQAQAVGAELLVAGTDFKLQSNQQAVGGRLISFTSATLNSEYTDLLLPLLGSHQGENAALAIAAVQSFLGRELEPELVAEGLAAVTSPGRLQLLGSDPVVITDAAHNPHGVTALTEALSENFSFAGGLCVVAGVLADKDAQAVLSGLATHAAAMVLVPVDSLRSLRLSELADLRNELADAFPELEITVAETAYVGFDEARDWASQEPDRGVLIAGSVLLAGSAIAVARDEEW